MRRATKWLGALVFGLCVALTPNAAQAGFVIGGSTEPVNSSVSGFVDVQVYSLSGGAADPYGIGISAAALQAVGFTSAGADSFLYLYRTVNLGTDIFQNTVASNPVINHGAGSLAGLTYATGSLPIAFGGNGGPPVPGDNFASFKQELNATPIVAGGTAPFSVVQGVSSLAATYIPNLMPAGAFSSLFGYTSNVAPVFTTTSIQDSGNSATGTVLGTPEPASIVMIGLGAAGMCGYGWKKRQQLTA
jgi:hypothetical protein